MENKVKKKTRMKVFTIWFDTNLNSTMRMDVKAVNEESAKRKIKKEFPSAKNFQ